LKQRKIAEKNGKEWCGYLYKLNRGRKKLLFNPTDNLPSPNNNDRFVFDKRLNLMR